MTSIFNLKSKVRDDAIASKPTPWVEKYRPKSIKDVSSQEEAVCVLRTMIESANLPHLLFYGPPGTGKTSTILALARELYGPELLKTRVLELNASDERGINVVREKVKNFARTTLSGSSKDYPCPPYKIVILDEADSMTTDAQAALRRTMETYSKITRFCLICNFVSKIIEPLASRCAKFRFRPIEKTAMLDRLDQICSAEGALCDRETIGRLVEISGGDLRRAIMYLQTATKMCAKQKISTEILLEIAGMVPPETVADVLQVASSNSFEKIRLAVDDVVRNGYSAAQLISALQVEILNNCELSSLQKAKIAIEMGYFDKILLDGGNEHLIILALVAKIAQIVSSKA